MVGLFGIPQRIPGFQVILRSSEIISVNENPGFKKVVKRKIRLTIISIFLRIGVSSRQDVLALFFILVFSFYDFDHFLNKFPNLRWNKMVILSQKQTGVIKWTGRLAGTRMRYHSILRFFGEAGVAVFKGSDDKVSGCG